MGDGNQKMINNTITITDDKLTGILTYTKNDKVYKLYLNIKTNLSTHYISDVYIGTGFDFDEAMMSLCSDLGLLKPLPGCKYVAIPKRKYNIKHITSHKKIVKGLYKKLLEENLILKSNHNYPFSIETFGYHKRNNHFDNGDIKQRLVHESNRDATHLSMLHISNGDGIIEVVRKYGEVGKDFYIYNSIINGLSGKSKEPLFNSIIVDKNIDLSTKCIDNENKLIEDNGYKSLLKPYLSFRPYSTPVKDNSWVYISNYITFKITTCILKDGRDGYQGELTYNLLGRRSSKKLQDRSINKLINLIVDSLYNDLLHKDIVSISKIYNKTLFLFDNSFLMGRVGEKLNKYLITHFNNSLK